MALFDYRTPAEVALTKFTSEEQSRISNAAVGKLADLEKNSSTHFSYALKPWARRRLTEAGCYLSVHSFIPHSHPVCKTIENHLLLNVLPSYLTPDFLVISMKKNKLAWLRHKTGFDMLSICNRFVSSKDPFRYGLDKYFEEAKMHISENVPEISEPSTLRDLVPRALRKKNRRFLLHDEIHYWSLDDLNNFLVLTKPEVVVATHVFPKELLAGSKESLNSWAYTFRVKDKKLFFYPDGVLEEGYEQPLCGALILTMGRFITSEGDIYSIDVPYSLFSHSLVTITKGKLMIPSYRSFSRFDATCGGKLNHFGGTAGDILKVRPEIFKNLYMYLHTLKKPDKQSAVAKMRQMCVDPSGYEIRFIEDFAQFVLNVDPTGDMILQTLMHRFHKFVLKLLPDLLKKNNQTFQEMSLSSFIEELQEFAVQIEVIDCYEHRYFHQILYDKLRSFYDILSGNLEDMERDAEIQKKIIHGRKRQLYIWVRDKKNGKVKVEICSFRRSSRFDCPVFSLFHRYDEAFCGEFRSKFLSKIGDSELTSYLSFFDVEITRKFEKIGRLGMYRLCKKIYNEFFVLKEPLSEGGNLIGWVEEVDVVNDWVEVNEKEQKGENDRKKEEEDKQGQEGERKQMSPYTEIKKRKPTDSKPEEALIDICSDNDSVEAYHESLEELEDGEKDSAFASDADELSNCASDSKSVDISDECLLFGVVCHTSAEEYEERRGKLHPVETKADGDCFWHCLSCRFGGDVQKIKESCLNFFLLNFSSGLQESEVERITHLFEPHVWAENEIIAIAASFLNCKILVFSEEHFICQSYIPTGNLENEVMISHSINHFSILFPKNICVIKSIANALVRENHEILKVVNKSGKRHIIDAINEGEGIPFEYLSELFKLFNINAIVHEEDSQSSYNEDGLMIRHFLLLDNHLSFITEHSANSRVNIERKEPIQSLSKVSVERVLRKLKVKELSYRPSWDRALNLQESFLEGFTGKILSRTFSNQKEWIAPNSREVREVKIFPFVGTFGSGKSYMVKKMVKENPMIKFLIISPRKALAEAFRVELEGESSEKLPLNKEPFSAAGFKERKDALQGRTVEKKNKNFRILTFEVALMRKVEKNVQVIMDEAQLFPPGYLDLFLIYNDLENVVLLGDPAQSSYDSETDRFKFIGLNNDLVNLLDGKRYQYLSLSKRFHNPFFLERLPCSFEIKGQMEEIGYFIHKNLRHDIETISSYDAILVPSFEDKQLLMLIFKKKKVPIFTYGESTGLTFNRGAVLLNEATRKVGEERILVALSRFRVELNFINSSGVSFEDFITSCNSSLLINFCTKRASLDDLRNHLPGEPIFVRSFNLIGHDEIDREERLEGDPWLKTMIFLGQRENAEEFEGIAEFDPKQEIMKSHQPIHTIQSVRAGLCDKFRERMGREMRVKDLITDQFRDSYFCKDVRQTSNQCELFEAIYPRHKNNDTATFLMAVQKRLSFDTPEANMANFRASRSSGKIMLEVFKQFVPITPDRNTLLLEEAQNEFEVKKLGKPKAVIENHSGRSSRDWNICEAFVFMKSQLCTKFEKRFCEAKAGQTLACFSHIVLCRFAPWIRYIEKKVNEVLPKNFYIHNGKNFDELNNFVVKRGFREECTESDYEAFDASQDVNIMSFEVELMRYFQIPEDVIADYIYIKANLFSKLGNFSVMRFTGEAGTFLFNTLANMVFTFMRYDLSGSESVCFAGDDMCANKPLRVKHEFADLLNKLKLKAKVEIKREATFCGWVLTKDGIYKKPQLVQERFEISKERGTFFDCLENYAIEVSYAYKMSERGLLIMSEEEQESQHLCVREVVKHKKYLKSWVSEVFESVM